MNLIRVKSLFGDQSVDRHNGYCDLNTSVVDSSAILLVPVLSDTKVVLYIKQINIFPTSDLGLNGIYRL